MAKITEVVAQIVDILSPLSSEERKRVITASLTLIGDEPGTSNPKDKFDDSENGGGNEELDYPVRAKAWMRQNDISADELDQVFHVSGSGVDIIASEIPGRSDREKVYSAYVLCGIASLLSSGAASFTDEAARELCKSSGCFDSANHSKYLKNKGNEFTGTKDKGWVLTNPGLKRGAELVKELTKSDK